MHEYGCIYYWHLCTVYNEMMPFFTVESVVSCDHLSQVVSFHCIFLGERDEVRPAF